MKYYEKIRINCGHCLIKRLAYTPGFHKSLVSLLANTIFDFIHMVTIYSGQYGTSASIYINFNRLVLQCVIYFFIDFLKIRQLVLKCRHNTIVTLIQRFTWKSKHLYYV